MTSLGPPSPYPWTSNLSSAFWNPVTRRLWLANNSGGFTVLKENGSGGFLNERNYNPSGGLDLEGITQADLSADVVYLLVENAEDIRAYSITSGALILTWDLTPTTGALANNGTEGIAFIPDAWLAASGFRDKDGNPYPNSIHGASGLGGVMLVAVQGTSASNYGCVYAVDLKNDGTHALVGKYKTSRNESCDLAFDASIGCLYILHNINGNVLELTDLTSSVSGADRKFTTLREIQVPSGSNIEGFALTPAKTSGNTVGDQWCFFTDDDDDDGALRWFKNLPSPISVLAGNNQVAPIASPVAVPPSVMVKDAFQNPVPGFAVNFTVSSGGGATTGEIAVTQSSGIATVGTWTLGPNPGMHSLSAAGSGLFGSPVVFNATAPVDSNSNNIPDTWELYHFGSTTNPMGAADYDWDHDGQDNLHEHLAGTNPTDPASVFEILSISRDPGGNVQLRWASVSGKRYGIQTATDPQDFQNTRDAPMTGTGGILTKTITSDGITTGFFRIVVIP